MADNNFEILEAQQREKQILANIQHVSHNCETIVDGKYCPKFTVSTNNQTEYVTVTFSTVGVVALNIMMTKKEYAKFATYLGSFLNSFIHDIEEKQLIKG